MKIAGMYSMNNGEESVFLKHQDIYTDMVRAIHSIDSEKAMAEGILHTPLAFRVFIKQAFKPLEWKSFKSTYTASNSYYTLAYDPEEDRSSKNVYLDIDFIVERLGIEVTFSKHPNMIYSTCTKMAIFRRLDLIDMGVVIVPIKRLSQDMRTEISSFEQVTWDLDHRGTSEIDVPVMIIGVDI